MSREIFDLPPYSEIWKDTKKRTPLSKERELLREIMGYIASGVVSITSNDLGDAAETLHEIQELLAQPEQEGVYQKLSRIEDGIEVEIFPSELWLDGYEAGRKYPQKRDPLSDAQIAELWGDKHSGKTHMVKNFARAIEKEHGIGVEL